MGLAIGAEADVMPFLISRYFGLRSMATLFGVLFGSYTMGVAIGRYLLGAGFDATGSYRRPLGYAFGLLVLAVIATFMLPRYKRSDNVTCHWLSSCRRLSSLRLLSSHINRREVCRRLDSLRHVAHLTPVTMLQRPKLRFTSTFLKPASVNISVSSFPEYCLPSVHKSMVME